MPWPDDLLAPSGEVFPSVVLAPPDVDIFGNIVDADTIEGYVRQTLIGPDPADLSKGWLVAHLAHQERRRGLAARALPQPKSWPTVSEFDIEAHEQMPAVVIVSPGTIGEPEHDRGVYRTVWRIETAVAIAGKDEVQGRMLAALYLAAVKGALIQNPTLGGKVEQCRWTGPDDHAFGTTERGSQRAIYGTAFAVTVRDAVGTRKGTQVPPADPYNPPLPPDYPNVAEITVTATSPEDTP